MRTLLTVLACVVCAAVGFVCGRYQPQSEDDLVREKLERIPMSDDVQAIAYLALPENRRRVGGMKRALKLGVAKHGFTMFQLDESIRFCEIEQAREVARQSRSVLSSQ